MAYLVSVCIYTSLAQELSRSGFVVDAGGKPSLSAKGRAPSDQPVSSLVPRYVPMIGNPEESDFERAPIQFSVGGSPRLVQSHSDRQPNGH